MVGRRTTARPLPRPVRAGRGRRLLISLGIGLFVLEAGLRVLLGNFGQSMILKRSDSPEVCLELQPDSEVLYTGWLARVAPTTMRTNSVGARGSDFTPRPATGTLRIAGIGDSFTFGQGVEEDQTFLQALADDIEDQGTPTEILNFGVPGHGTPQSVALAREKVLALEPHLVLLNVFANDLSVEESFCLYGQGGNSLTRLALRHWYAGRLAYMMARPLLPKPHPPSVTESPSDRFQKALRELKELGRERGFLVAVVLLTDREMFLNSAHCQNCIPAHDLVGATGIRVIDLSSTWLSLQQDIDRNYIRGEDHFTAAGNKVVGRQLARSLRGWAQFSGLVDRLGSDPPEAP